MKTKKALLPFLIISCFTFSPIKSSGADFKNELSLLEKTGEAFASVAQKTTPAVVFIEVEKTLTQGSGQGYYSNNPYDALGDEFFQRLFRGNGRQYMVPRQFKQQAAGSGFIISKDGYILTNNHVVGDADKITVKLQDGREFEAKLIGADPKSEVAVIKIDATNLPILELGNSDTLKVGHWVIAIGNPLEFFTGSVTVGVVSAKGRNNLQLQDVEYEDFIQTDAAINPGNSGGPLLDINGKVIGINTAIISNSGGYMGIGFAIPINMAIAIKDQLINTGKVVRGFLGIQIQQITPQLAEAFKLSDTKGILVAGVQEGSAAEKAGLKTEDIIVELNGNEIKSVNTFRNQVSSCKPGTSIKLSVLRDNKKLDITAVTAAIDNDGTEIAGDVNLYNKLGISVDEINNNVARRFGYRMDEGVIVTEVANDSPAAEAGIEPGSMIKAVNRRKVTSIAEFQDALKLSAESHTVLMLVKNDRYVFYVTISLDD